MQIEVKDKFISEDTNASFLKNKSTKKKLNKEKRK